jgi:hypothetical protein
MKRALTVFAIAPILFGIAFAWQSSNADDEKIESTVRPEQPAVQLELIERIEALEKRLEKLEAKTMPVRQADHREPIYVPTPRTLPSATASEDHEGSSRTNGQKWQIKMLSHRQSTDGPR